MYKRKDSRRGSLRGEQEKEKDRGEGFSWDEQDRNKGEEQERKMGKNRKRLSGAKRRDIKKKWKARTFMERSSESSEEKDSFGDQMKMKARREEVGAAKASVSDLVGRVKWRLARMEERLSRGEGDLERRIEEVKAKLWRLKYLSWLKNRQMRPTTSAQHPAISKIQEPIGTPSRPRAPGRQPIATDPSRALRNLRKKLRDIEALEEKLVLGKISAPEPEQLEKVARKSEVMEEIVVLEKIVA